MSVKIRLTRIGRKHSPKYRLIAANSRAPRDGKFLEILGFYDPMISKGNKGRLSIKEDAVNSWIAKGAIPTDVVKRLIKENNTPVAEDEVNR